MGIKIIDAKRTAIGKFLGSFYEANCADVCIQLAKGLYDSSNIDPKKIDMAIFGNVVSAGLGQGIARKIALDSGMDIASPAYVTSMVCGSGMQAIFNACNEIKLGSKLILTGGFEFMSNIPYATDTYLRLGKKFGDFNMTDLITHDGLHDSFSGVHMGITAENIARDLEITREMQDAYALITHQRALEAVGNNYFVNEIVPIKLVDYRKNEYIFSVDEFPNPKSTAENLAKLKPSFIKDGTGTVTAGNSSGINDGASFLLLASDEFCKENNIDAKIEIVDYCAVGCDPQKMGLGPYYAISKLLEKTKLDIKDIDVFEINEAFAAQILGCIKLLNEKYNLEDGYLVSKTNLHGSGLGLGHPLGCSGARITTTLYHHMLQNGCKYGIASLCVGGGQGLAILLKKVD